MTTDPGTLEPKGAPAGAAVDWIRQGWQAFTGAAGLWVAIWFVFMVIVLSVGLLPVVGIVGGALVPILAGGVMRGAQAQRDFGALRFDHLFEGFTHHLDQLGILGLIYLGATMAFGLMLVAGVLAAGGVLGVAGLARVADGLGPGLDLAPAVLLGTIVGAATIFVAAFAVLGMAMWWAPALVAIDGVPAVAALRLSLTAVMRNLLPLTVHSLIVMLLSVAALLTFGLGFLVLGPVIAVSLWAAYREVFH
jgi:uncharacterized membrane protein